VIANDFQWKSLSPTSSTLQRLASPTTLSLASILNRFLSARVVSPAKLQLVGMFLAAKEEEIAAPSAMNFLHCADSSYTEAEILQAKKYILKALEWNMNYPNPILRRVSKADEYNVQACTAVTEELPSLKALIRAQRERAIAAGIDPDAIDIMEEGGLRDQS
jgi:hypothetical protein